MRRLEREWLLGPIWGVLGCGALMGAHGCGGNAASPHGSMPDRMASDDSAAAAGRFGEGVIPSVVGGAGTSGMGSNTGGMGGAGGEPTGSIWEYTSGDMPSAEHPVPVECHGFDGADQDFRLAQGRALAFCGRSLPHMDRALGLCLPAPPPGQTCAEAYPLASVASIWNCGHNQIASYVCGHGHPRPVALGVPGTNAVT